MHTAANMIYRFTVIKHGVTPDLVKTLVMMAIRETDLVYSPARRKLDTDVRVDAEKPLCIIEGGTECGDHLARLLCGFLIKQVGEDGFVVRRAYPKKGRQT